MADFKKKESLFAGRDVKFIKVGWKFFLNNMLGPFYTIESSFISEFSPRPDKFGVS